MGAAAWEEIYATYSSEELDAEIVELKKLSNFNSQTVGGKSYSVDSRMIGEKLQAAVRVKKRMGSASSGRSDSVAVVDFSGGVRG